LIIGAKGDIARHIAKVYAKHGYGLYLAGRDISDLEHFKNEIKKQYNISVKLKNFDITEYDSHKHFYDSLNPKPYGTIIVSGYMHDQRECETNLNKSLNTINVNYTGVVSILNIIANDLEKIKEGFIIGVSSVAGDRGRRANYIYGSSKAALSTYLSGLRNRLFKSNINVLTVKPGFVRTEMTRNLDLPAFLTSEPYNVAEDIFIAQQKEKNILYTKSIWKYVMFFIRSIPEWIFKKTNF
tara:strand:+ start:378 stop:1097 length:720 start_codon:yes stop_codon:yes gene_type:complete